MIKAPRETTVPGVPGPQDAHKAPEAAPDATRQILALMEALHASQTKLTEAYGQVLKVLEMHEAALQRAARQAASHETAIVRITQHLGGKITVVDPADVPPGPLQ
jgi:hypothetical protein